VTAGAGDSNPAPQTAGERDGPGVQMIYELMGRGHAAIAAARGRGAAGGGERGQGTVEYVGLVLLVAVLIAGVVKASGGFSDTGIAEAVVKKLKAAIDGVGRGE
jgi:hypothetical protein